MPIDWDAFDKEVNGALDHAEGQTDEKLALRISSLTRMTGEEIEALFPKPADVKKLAQLLKIVKSAEAHNVKVTRLIANIEDLGGTVVKLIDKIA
jgi:hypothetical protein